MDKRQKILIVDDAGFNRDILKEILGETYSYLESENGNQAIQIMEENLEIDLMLLDINMPQMNGFEVLEWMNRFQLIDETPVIMISSEESVDTMRKAYECEIDSDRFQVKLATYDSDNGEEQLNAVIKSNPDIFTKKDIGGNSTYYCPGSKYDWSDCYAMVVDHKLLVVNIEKEYDQYIEWVLGHITLQ